MDRTRLRSDVIAAEGLRQDAYKDTLGFWTAGVGHLLPQHQDWTGQKFALTQVYAWLDADLDKAVSLARDLPEWSSIEDSNARGNAVVELVFNLGLAHWRAFAHTRYCLCQKQWQGAHDGLLASLWAKQVGPRRSERLANCLLTGEFA